MYQACNDCAIPCYPHKEVDALESRMENNEKKDFQQDGEIVKLNNMWRCEVCEAVAAYMDVLKVTGELDELLANCIDALQPYYSGITTEKKTAYNTDYYVTIVPRFDANGKLMRWQLGVANDAYNGVGVESTVDFAHRKNATLAINCGVFDTKTYEPLGVLIKDGRIVRNGAPAEDKYQYLAIMNNGSFRVYPRTTSAGKMIMDGATDAVCIFGSLLKDGELVEQTDLRYEPRQSIGVCADGKIIIVSVDGRKPGEDKGMNYSQLAEIHAGLGSVNAWILDGGGSVATVLRGVKQNDNIDYFHTDRKVNNFLYLAKDTIADSTTSPANDLGAVKQKLIEQIVENINFHNGFIRLHGKEGYYAPGIEMYVNGEETRRSKVGMSFDPDEVRNSYVYISFRPEDSELSNMFRIYKQGVYIQTYHGPSSERPSAPVGFMYYDETINKPIWRAKDGRWLDANGEPA